MTEDRELDTWREQWSGVAKTPADFQPKIQLRIRQQNLRFILGNVLTAIAFGGILIFAVVMRIQSEFPGKGWVTATCVLVAVSVAYRIWILRGTWRSDAQSIRTNMELWRSRVLARVRLLKMALYISCGWIVCCVALMAANWATIRVDVNAHPNEWFWGLVVCVLMQPVILFGAAWIRRRNQAELQEVEQILAQLID